MNTNQAKTINAYSSQQGVAVVEGLDNTLVAGACSSSSSCCG
ncbi:hypothetical protein [Tenacibaculum sp. M341]|nr:hypothetical protein [Tenacibaculum sp. M341]